MTPEEIQKRISKSQQKHQLQVQKAKERKEQLKEGRKTLRQYFKKNNGDLYKVELYNGFKIAVFAFKGGFNKTLTSYFTFAICSPKDTWSSKIAKGLIGKRIERGDVYLYVPLYYNNIDDLINKIIENFVIAHELGNLSYSAYSNKFAIQLIKELKEERSIIKSIEHRI